MTYNTKNWKRKNNKDMDYDHGGLGHQFQESWPYLSNATPQLYELSHVKNEFSLVGLTECQYENGQSERESAQKEQWVQIKCQFCRLHVCVR